MDKIQQHIINTRLTNHTDQEAPEKADMKSGRKHKQFASSALHIFNYASPPAHVLHIKFEGKSSL